ncbi:MAG: NusG domain II-containing protein, partial [Deferrisomatales bacterium]
GGGGPPAAVEVITPAGRERVGLGAPRRLEARGPLGITVIRVDAEGARVESSPCGLQLCVRTGRVSRPGQAVACLPNRVAVLVRGSGPGGVDAVGR